MSSSRLAAFMFALLAVVGSGCGVGRNDPASGDSPSSEGSIGKDTWAMRGFETRTVYYANEDMTTIVGWEATTCFSSLPKTWGRKTPWYYDYDLECPDHTLIDSHGCFSSFGTCAVDYCYYCSSESPSSP